MGYLQHHGCPTPLLDWTFRFGHALFFALEGIQPNLNTREIGDYFSVYYLEEKYFDAGGEWALLNMVLQEANETELHRFIELVTDNKGKRDETKKHFKGREILDRKRFNGSGFIAHMLAIKRMVNIGFTYFSERDAESGIIFSLNNNSNILKQEGVFTWTADPCKPVGMVAREEFHAANLDAEQNDYRFCKCFNINKDLQIHILIKLQNDGITREHIYPNANRSTWDVFERAIDSE